MASGQSQSSDSMDAMFDFGEYDNSMSTYQSPSLSPAASSKNAFVRPISQAPTPIMPAPAQPLSGPSHQYELYKQQTGIVPGALASTLAISQNSQVPAYNGMGLDCIGLSPEDAMFDFNTPPSQASFGELDMDFDRATTDQFFFDDTVNPTALGEASSSMAPPQSLNTATNNGRLWPGMHSQAAMAKAQAQRQQQQQQQQQQQLQQRQMNQLKPRSKSSQPTDPIVEQKITQLLNSMRAKPSLTEAQQAAMAHHNIPRLRKDEDDMDEDERLLASEEGKKLTSKERRQLRNKVSARAFRSRRKEYITQLEAEIANKVSENSDLRTRNHALEEENKRLGDLTRMLLSSPSFSDFLDQMSNPTSVPQPSPQVQSQPQSIKQERRQLPKDVNPYASNQQVEHQHIGMAMIPETPMDMSMLTLDHDSTYSFQPQVYALLETPGMPASIDASILSGKKSNFVGEQMTSDDDKVEMPAIEHPMLEKSMSPQAPAAPPLDPEFESNPEFALYHASADEARTEVDAEDTWQVDIFGGLEPEKVLARYDLIDASEQEQSAVLTVARVQRICDRLESTWERINQLTADF